MNEVKVSRKFIIDAVPRLCYAQSMQVNTFTFQGTLIQNDITMAKTGKAFAKFLVQAREDSDNRRKQSTQKLIAFGFVADKLSRMSLGTEIICMGVINSSEHNGKTYPDLLVNNVYLVEAPSEKLGENETY